jgi:drug/metabolite transporter (DMT)-like permease|tara:strand:+ start:1496 stop:2380 length:885 start_codon:yes stop_codon:yes gene_type:complete
MSTNRANLLMLVATLIWGTAFVSQTTGMGSIGPFTFSFSRFLLAMLTVLPLALIYERNNFSLFYKNTNLIYLSLLTGLALFGGMGLQQYALLESQIANAAFLSTLYVPIVSLISRFIFRSRLHWIMWIAVLLCLYGSYLLSSNQTLDIQQSDALLFIAAFFFAIHIILIDIFMKQFYSPFTFGFIQYTIVFLCSLIIAFIFESPTIANIKIEWFEIIYTGVFSAGIGYTLQIIAQSKAGPAPAAIILSMESVFGALAGWIMLNQVLDTNKVLGCLAIFLGVIIVQLIPIYTNRK